MKHHVLVTLPDDPEPHPGLLVEWEQRESGWFGLVVYIVGERAVTEWLPRECLSPVAATPYTGSAYG